MKKEIIGYVSGYINGYEGVISEMKISNEDVKRFKFIKNEFNDLLDYIIDIPEENTDVTEVNARYADRIQELEMANKTLINENRRYYDGAKDMQELKSQLAETEESLQNIMDNESRLNKRVEKAETLTNAWKATTLEVVEENEVLRKQLTKLTGPQWVED